MTTLGEVAMPIVVGVRPIKMTLTRGRTGGLRLVPMAVVGVNQQAMIGLQAVKGVPTTTASEDSSEDSAPEEAEEVEDLKTDVEVGEASVIAGEEVGDVAGVLAVVVVVTSVSVVSMNLVMRTTVDRDGVRLLIPLGVTAIKVRVANLSQMGTGHLTEAGVKAPTKMEQEAVGLNLVQIIQGRGSNLTTIILEEKRASVKTAKKDLDHTSLRSLIWKKKRN